MTTMKSMSPFDIADILLILITTLSLLLWQIRRQLAQARTTTRYFTQHYRHLIGSTCLWKGSHGEPFSYNLRSFDGGHSWVAVTHGPDSQLTIIGEVNQLYPGLLTHLHATNALVEHCASTGPLHLSHPRDQQLLTDAGFTIRHTQDISA